jgi:arginine decarboxylase
MKTLVTASHSPHALSALPRALNIHMASGAGEGPTELAAFDAALMDAGVANYNLLCLSSVIPPNATIVRARHRTLQGDHGRRLYVVMSQMRQSGVGRPAYAGIGWVQQADDGPGLFVELHDDDRDRLEADLHATLNAMRAYRDIDFGPVQTQIASTTCIAQPVCALVVAVFACEPW